MKMTQKPTLQTREPQIVYNKYDTGTKKPQNTDEPLLSFNSNNKQVNSTETGIGFAQGAEIVFQGAKDNLVNKVKDGIEMFKNDPVKGALTVGAGVTLGLGVVAIGMIPYVGPFISGGILATMGGVGLYNQAKEIGEEIDNIKDANGDDEEIKEALYNIGGNLEDGLEDAILLAAGAKQIKTGADAIKAAKFVDDTWAAIENSYNATYKESIDLGKTAEEAHRAANEAASKIYQKDAYFSKFQESVKLQRTDNATYAAGITAGITEQDEIKEFLDKILP